MSINNHLIVLLIFALTELASAKAADDLSEDLFEDPIEDCRGLARTKRAGLSLLTSVKNDSGRQKKGEYLCSLPANTRLCVLSGNMRPGRWVEVRMTREVVESLPMACRTAIEKKFGDRDEVLLSTGTHRGYFEADSGAEAERVGKTKTAAAAECRNCKESGGEIAKSAGAAQAIEVAAEASKPRYIFPVDQSHGFVTSASFVKRKDPVTGAYTRVHTGLDIGSIIPKAPIMAAREGEVIRLVSNCANKSRKAKQRNCGGGWGNQVWIQHDDGTVGIYGHLDSRCDAKLEKGQIVTQGQQIGCMGQSGHATGPHLCFNIRKNPTGRYINVGRALGSDYKGYLKKWERGFHTKRAQKARELSNPQASIIETGGEIVN